MTLIVDIRHWLTDDGSLPNGPQRLRNKALRIAPLIEQVWVSATERLNVAVERDLLGTIGEKSSRSQKIRLGKALNAARDRHFGEWRVVAGRNTDGNSAKYRLIKGNAAAEHELNPQPAQQQLELRA